MTVDYLRLSRHTKSEVDAGASAIAVVHEMLHQH